MDVKPDKKTIKKIKKNLLVFFCFICFIACEKEQKNAPIEVNYEQGKAVAISFQSHYDIEKLSVHLKGVEFEVLGVFEHRNKRISFTPAVPFAAGKTYQLRFQQGAIAEFRIKSKKQSKKPRVMAIYPSTDTVPENLLKIYIQFSQPMQEVIAALDYIKVFDADEKELTDVFLELETELWNKEHTLLTLWLDPGRIKKDLIPNKEKGLPLKSGNTYRIEIDDQWKDAEGRTLYKSVTKTLVVEAKKQSKPNIETWDLTKPPINSKEPLVITFKEPLDAVLLMECVSVYSEDGILINGRFSLIRNEYGLAFIPDQNWKKGNYQLRILSLLEDLAGNNLNRLFDTDLLDNAVPLDESESKSLEFDLN